MIENIKLLSVQILWLYLCAVIASFFGALVMIIATVIFQIDYSVAIGSVIGGSFLGAIIGPMVATPILVIFFLPWVIFLQNKKVKNAWLWLVPPSLIACTYALFLCLIMPDMRNPNNFLAWIGVFVFTGFLTALLRRVFYLNSKVVLENDICVPLETRKQD